jgi:hypothetical protein
VSKRVRLADLECFVSDCPKLVGDKGARGLCPRHYQRSLATGSPTGSNAPRADDRVFSRTFVEGECWMWDGAIDQSGYGMFRSGGGVRNGTILRTHIWSYLYFVADIPAGYQIDHTCHSKVCDLGIDCPHRRCLNPAHLEAVPPHINTDRGRGSKRTHCPCDHEYTVENTYVNPKGMQVCRACKPRHMAKYELKKRNQLQGKAAS